MTLRILLEFILYHDKLNYSSAPRGSNTLGEVPSPKCLEAL